MTMIAILRVLSGIFYYFSLTVHIDLLMCDGNHIVFTNMKGYIHSVNITKCNSHITQGNPNS